MQNNQIWMFFVQDSVYSLELYCSSIFHRLGRLLLFFALHYFLCCVLLTAHIMLNSMKAILSTLHAMCPFYEKQK